MNSVGGVILIMEAQAQQVQRKVLILGAIVLMDHAAIALAPNTHYPAIPPPQAHPLPLDSARGLTGDVTNLLLMLPQGHCFTSPTVYTCAHNPVKLAEQIYFGISVDRCSGHR